MGNAKNDFIIPIVVLTVICIVTSAALAATQQVTAPIIAAAEKAAAEAARLEVLPGSASFEVITLSPMPDGIEEIFKSDKGLVVQATVKGYGGPMKIMVGLDNDGKIVKTKTLLHAETAGLGSKTAEEPFQTQFVGKDAALEGVSTIGGATISSNAFIDGVKKALDAATAAAGGTSTSPVGVTEEKLKSYFPTATTFEEKTVEGSRVIVCGTDGVAIFTTAKGYGGDMVVATLIGTDGKIAGVIVDRHMETAGIGSKIAEKDYTAQFIGRTDANVDGIPEAAASSDALKQAITDALAKYPTVKGAL